ncbi:MAG: pyruvate dehydrogenase (acetyl-transferring) E1 component subunit alpha [Cryobacterium sp.]|nr:pyruvate dehydrogenase (acetyl-transferring) E1 component subunit alpha [Cryobacterium sp.]
MSLNVETRAPVVLPDPEPLRLIDDTGRAVPVKRRQGFELPSDERLLELYRAMVVARRWDTQVTALTRQGRLATYPSALGQEATEIGSVLALEKTDWLFPTYRDSIALMTRGINPVEILSGFRGDWHSGWDPHAHRTSTQSTPLATQALHAVGMGMAAKLRGDSVATLTFVGDGATSEGDTHEAFNFAGVWQTPTVFIIQNNQFAISVPLAKQTRARTLADRAIGYGVPGYYVDGNDAAAVHAIVTAALDRARSGDGPTIIECVTYRIEAHTNSDDPSRYRSSSDVTEWKSRDPLERLEKYLVSQKMLTDAVRESINTDAEKMAELTRDEMNAEVSHDPMELFENVYAAERPGLREQRDFLAAEIAAEAAAAVGSGVAS